MWFSRSPSRKEAPRGPWFLPIFFSTAVSPLSRGVPGVYYSPVGFSKWITAWNRNRYNNVLNVNLKKTIKVNDIFLYTGSLDGAGMRETAVKSGTSTALGKAGPFLTHMWIQKETNWASGQGSAHHRKSKWVAFVTYKVVEGIGIVQERVLSSPVSCVLGYVSSRLQVPFVQQRGGNHEAFLAIPNRLVRHQPVNGTVTWMGPSERRLTLLPRTKPLTVTPGEFQSTQVSGFSHLPCYSQKEKWNQWGRYLEAWNHVKSFLKTSTRSLTSNVCIQEIIFTNPLI